MIRMKSCKDITELVEKKKVVGLSLKEIVQVKIHLAVCKLCRNFSRDSDYLDGLLKKIQPRLARLSPEERAAIKKRL